MWKQFWCLPCGHQEALCQGWNWLSGCGEENFIILSMYFHYFELSPLGMGGGGAHLKKLESPLPKGVLCQFWLKFPLGFWKRKMKMCKVYDNNNNDDRQQTKLTWAFCSGELEMGVGFSGGGGERQHFPVLIIFGPPGLKITV